MLIIPAIDIKNGKCVRLTQGIFQSEKVYCDNPVDMAKKWEQMGAKTLHIVDLDGAKKGVMANLNAINKIIKAISIPIQVGGGIRDEATAKILLGSGVPVIVLGTIALENKILLLKLLKKYGHRIIVALDTKNGNLVTKGWLGKTGKNCIETAKEFEKQGVEKFMYTDVIRDGTLTEPNYKEIIELAKTISSPILVGGGISSIDDIQKLKSIGIEGVIIGKALYENRIILKEAINAG
ncbi:1-(5-phosphoribosyl)-5-[(5-phosphoribosylamino)methylideneamino]imidazole-4-carboxamide isomerase [Candidatus Daviesbacteria bacterium]|nr:1-(5-phosphoribosyl)-5-[(5-phosphoribosylamino)methylideneamino]imidazole-4-carboxamide isomerase [Candidatus Daviesbacteria bacterium]